jgi:hypothetical protein
MDATELKNECRLDQSDEGVKAIDACQVSCKSTKCALAENCKDDQHWKHERTVRAGASKVFRCADYAVGKPGHRACCSDQGIGHGGTTVLAKDACPASCRTCDAQLNDLEFWTTADFMLALLALLPLLLRAADVGTAIQNALHCCAWPWSPHAATGIGGGGEDGGDSRRKSGSFGQVDSSVELESSPLKLSPASNSSTDTPSSSRSRHDSSHQLDFGTVWSGNAGVGGGIAGGSWEEGWRRRGITPCEAMQVTLYRLLGWHCCPALVYVYLVDEYYEALDDESVLFKWLAVAVGLRELAHLALALWCFCSRPIVFLVDLHATTTKKNAEQHLAICLFAPWLFLLRAALPMHAHVGYGATPDGGATSGAGVASGISAAPAGCWKCLCPGSVWLKLAELNTRERYTVGVVVSLVLLDMCNVFAFVTGVWIMVDDDEGGEGGGNGGQSVPFPIIVSLALGTVAWLALVATVAPRRAVEESDDSEGGSDGDDDDVYG